MIIKKIILGLLILVSIFGNSKQTYALTIPNIDLGVGDQVQIVTTATPTSTPTPTINVSIKPIKKTSFLITLKKTNAIKEINRRLEKLSKLSEKINSLKLISATQKENLLTQVKEEISKLEELKNKIEAETNATSLIDLKKSITESYRIYALFIPKIEIMAHAEKIISLADLMSGKTSNQESLNLLDSAKSKAQNAINQVSQLLPENYPECKTELMIARDQLKEARNILNEVYQKLIAD